jgi:DNA-binding beta-propeller fold protein YncE
VVFRRSVRRFVCVDVVLALAVGVAGLLTLSTDVASAEPPRLIPYGTFSAKFPFGVAVDQSDGDVYTAALAVADVNEFDASGGLISPPSPFGEGNFSGAAVNPVNGDLYVLTAVEPAAIDTYGPDGELLSSFEVPPSKNIGAGSLTGVQIATDSVGHVYVPVVPKDEVLEYEPASCPAIGELCVPLKTFTGGTGLKGPTGVAVDSAGDIWIADAGNKRLEELSPADVPLREIKLPGEVGREDVESVALDGHGDVFVIVKNGVDFCGSVTGAPPCSHLVEYDAAGVQVADVGAGSFETGPGSFQLPPMVAVDEGSGRVYVSDGKGEKVWIFGPPVAARVEKELASEVGVFEAKLGALVNPGGIETTYRFEYLSDAGFQANGGGFSGPEHAISVPFPEGSVGEGLASHAVWAAASGLTPGTTYDYRVVATSELGEAIGPAQTFTTKTAEQAACPNEQLRGGFSTELPDCRAYELVTAPTKTSVQVGEADAVALDGNAVEFNTHEPLPGAPTGGNSYIATRGADGWSSEDVIPLESYSAGICVSHSNAVSAFSSDLSKVLLDFGHDSRASEPEGSELETQECNAEGLQVVVGEPVGYQNLLLRDNTTGTYELVNTPAPGVTPADAHFKGASADLSHVVFGELAQLTSEAPAPPVGGPEDLYEWDEGMLRLLSVLPDGDPATGSLVEASNGSRAISAEGSRIAFTSDGSLYLRIDGERTVQVDESQGPGGSGGGTFQALSSDGSMVLFTDESRLTPGSTAATGEPDLYECVLPAGAVRCELRDLTVAKAGERADVLKVSTLASEDSAHVYFVARGVLAANTRELINGEGRPEVEGAEAGKDNLYMWDGVKTMFIATLSESDQGVGAVSPDGTWFAFVSYKSLTGYDNILPGGGPQPEVFLYSAGSDSHPPTLVCASCNLSGEAPLDGGTSLPPIAQRPLSDGGRLFFGTREELVPSDTNDLEDVYEYEGDRQSLISSGTSPRGSKFAGASENGNDVFFLSSQQLVEQDTQEEVQLIYDARVDGGFPAGSPPPPCPTADACRVPVPPQPSIYGAPASATFSGAGNLAPAAPPSALAVKAKLKPSPKALTCRRGFVKKRTRSKSRCVKKPTRKARKSTRAKKEGRDHAF